ncbi:MAG: heme o synthase [Pyrinomonadaceae bacterium]
METSTVEIVDTGLAGVRMRIGAFVELTKPRIAFMLVLTAAAGFYVAVKGAFDFVLFANSMIGITLLAFGVATLNQYIERDLDALMKRTAKRPLPLQKIAPVEALVFGVLQCAVAEVYLFALVNTLTATLGLVVIIGYVALYTPLKTRTSASTAIGAIPGALPPLMGWTAAANEVTMPALALFAMLFLWQFPHFFAIASMYREDYKKAGILMLPVVEDDGRLTARQIVVFAVMLFPVGLAPFFLGISGIVFLIGSAFLGGWFLVESIRTARARTPESARRLLMVSVIYLPLVFALLVVDRK